MSASRVRALALLTLALGAFSATTTRARADDCPLGSSEKTESGATWCEPSICDVDTQCATGSVCRPVALCVEVGALDKGSTKSDAAERLLVRQRCGANKSCPQNTTCSDKGRCITRAQADKAGLLAAPAGAAGSASAGAATGGGAGEAPKKACGCHVVGTSGGERGGAALALVAAALVVSRRRVRARD